jgi:hypothetical protein
LTNIKTNEKVWSLTHALLNDKVEWVVVVFCVQKSWVEIPESRKAVGTSHGAKQRTATV